MSELPFKFELPPQKPEDVSRFVQGILRQLGVETTQTFSAHWEDCECPDCQALRLEDEMRERAN